MSCTWPATRGFYHIGLSNAQHWQYAKPGQWNDPDYILIGWVGSAHGQTVGHLTTLTGNEQYSYMSMWSLMAAPLIFSGDMTRLDDFTLNILCNHEVIAVNQDPLGSQGFRLLGTDDPFELVVVAHQRLVFAAQALVLLEHRAAAVAEFLDALLGVLFMAVVFLAELQRPVQGVRGLCGCTGHCRQPQQERAHKARGDRPGPDAHE